MKNCELESLPEDIKDMLHRHTHLDANKVVSYLPLNTIENVIGISVGVYTSIIENNGGSYLIFGENECCISSGAVYAFLPKALKEILKINKHILTVVGVPCEPTGFIRAIADTWFENETSITPLLKELFGDN
jgi:hypothetical protein